MQERLFDPRPYGTSALESILEVLDMRANKYDERRAPFVRVTLRDNSLVLENGYTFGSKFTSQNRDEVDNSVFWDESQEFLKNYEGFLECVTTLYEEPDTYIIHLLQHCTDVDACSIGIRPDDIEKIYLYPKNFSEIMAAYQNAQVDGSTYFYQKFMGLPADPVFAPEELLQYITTYKPEPKLIYHANGTV